MIQTPALPFTIQPEGGADLDSLLETAAARRELWSEKLLAHGALLLRGYGVATVAAFQRFVAAFSGSGALFNYAGGASPRNVLSEAGGVYSSTEYPPDMTLSLHNELSYADVYPSRLFFFCLTAPKIGGETTLGDSRSILRSIDPDVLDAFREKQIRYVRNLSPDRGTGYSWQDAFETDNPDIAEARCREIGADFEWRPDRTLRMSQVRPATAAHPETGEEVWFNQADGFHPTALDRETYQALMSFAGSEENFRLGVTYGDGSPIDVDALEHVREVLRSETIPHRWRAGDILVLDNMLAAHGRMPFAGPRKIALAMT
jgi:alpha-ketoglutarate-dependent taurine dioxygenase